MARKAISVIGNFVIDLQLFAVSGDQRKRLAFVAGLEMTSATHLDRSGRGILQNLSGEHHLSFRSHQRRLEIFFRLIGVMTFDAGADSLSVGSVVLQRVSFVIEGDFAGMAGGESFRDT